MRSPNDCEIGEEKNIYELYEKKKKENNGIDFR